MQKTWFITGANRGLGAYIAQAALAAGERVVATARNVDSLHAALGAESDQLLALPLDVTQPAQIQAAVAAAASRFGGIDVLVNNAGYGHLGFFEETTPQDAQAQFATNLFGVFSLTQAVLPLMRAARKGHIFNLSSLAGVMGVELGALYCASKFALEGFSESIAKELAPFGIKVTIIEPGPFRTDFLTPESIRFGAHEIADYAERRAAARASFEQRNGKQPGDPAKLAQALLQLANTAEAPLRFIGGAVALNAAEATLAAMSAEIAQWRELTLAMDFPAGT